VGGGHEMAKSVLAWIFFSPPTRPLSMAASSSAQPTTNPQVSIFFVDFYFGYSSWVVCLIWLLWICFSQDLKLWFLRVVL
jgi:hypothetical protein